MVLQNKHFLLQLKRWKRINESVLNVVAQVQSTFITRSGANLRNLLDAKSSLPKSSNIPNFQRQGATRVKEFFFGKDCYCRRVCHAATQGTQSSASTVHGHQSTNPTMVSHYHLGACGPPGIEIEVTKVMRVKSDEWKCMIKHFAMMSDEFNRTF